MIYTYDDFIKKAQDEGLLEQFSDADLRLAKQHPDAGMSILGYKMDVRDAPNEEARVLANAGANGIRESIGGYTGGTHGDRFIMTQSSAMNPPTFQPYESRYDDQIQTQLQGLLNFPEFSYNLDTDPAWHSVKKTGIREGRRAMNDTLGAAAAMTGGRPSTYATTAATQANDYHVEKMQDIIPQLYQNAYNHYLDKYTRQMQGLKALQGADQYDFQKYQVGNQYKQQDFQNKSTVSDREIGLAELGGKWGDTSGLQALGINPNPNLVPGAEQLPAPQATGGGGRRSHGGSGGKAGGNDETAAPGGYPELSPDDRATIDAAAKNGTLAPEDWDYLCGIFGEEQMLAAGYSRADAGAENRDSGVPTTYTEFVEETGYRGILTQDDFNRAQARGEGEMRKYINYKAYLADMYQKHKK